MEDGNIGLRCSPLQAVVEVNSAGCSINTAVQMLELVPDPELPCTCNKIGVITGVHVDIITTETMSVLHLGNGKKIVIYPFKL